MCFSMSRGLAPKESLAQTLQVPKVVRRRQVRIGIRGRIVTVEVRQARIVTVVSIAGAKDGAKAETYRQGYRPAKRLPKIHKIRDERKTQI